MARSKKKAKLPPRDPMTGRFKKRQRRKTKQPRSKRTGRFIKRKKR